MPTRPPIFAAEIAEDRLGEDDVALAARLRFHPRRIDLDTFRLRVERFVGFVVNGRQLLRRDVPGRAADEVFGSGRVR